MKDVIGIKLTAYKMNGERTMQVNAEDKKDLCEIWAGATSYGKPIVWTEEEVKTKATFLISQMGDFINSHEGFSLEYIRLTKYTDSLYQEELTVANDGMEVFLTAKEDS